MAAAGQAVGRAVLMVGWKAALVNTARRERLRPVDRAARIRDS